ncbi:Os05g0415001 [Oryza sativa Japonica Group]|uniref:Os05g0415001 protein n=1 Tax=Oryza sativa subsp. japonica TaxID=39947 RepID=A0A0P0WML2_ORYSJ|nr:Os05g0415001 [Oryza sativa Japonica Group]
MPEKIACLAGIEEADEDGLIWNGCSACFLPVLHANGGYNRAKQQDAEGSGESASSSVNPARMEVADSHDGDGDNNCSSSA